MTWWKTSPIIAIGKEEHSYDTLSRFKIDIQQIDLKQSKVGKDFGCGFYLSADKSQAQELAERKVEQLEEGTPSLNVYELDETQLRSAGFFILEFTGYTKEWAEFVLMNRQNKTRTPVHGYDVVIGPIADDSVGYQIRRFVPGRTEIYERHQLSILFRNRKEHSILEKVMSKETFMIEEISKEIVQLLMEEYQVDMRQALKMLYTSDTYNRLINLKTGLYAQSTAYVYEYLENELAIGKMR